MGNKHSKNIGIILDLVSLLSIILFISLAGIVSTQPEFKTVSIGRVNYLIYESSVILLVTSSIAVCWLVFRYAAWIEKNTNTLDYPILTTLIGFFIMTAMVIILSKLSIHTYRSVYKTLI